MVPSPRYVRLTELAQIAFRRGRLVRALRLFEVAEEEARNSNDRELADRAFCNRCVVLAELDRLSLVSGELKHILMRSRDPFTAWMAAYYTSQAYEAEDNVQRALAYARRASELAASCGDKRALKGSANQLGVLALRDSRFGEAAECLRAALSYAVEDRDDELNIAVARDNLGYCLMCTGSVADGLTLCGEAAAMLDSIGARHMLAEVYQDLCYGALQREKFTEARAWGDQALALAREFDNPAVERNTLMLLADAAMDEEDEEIADHYLERLAAHYPDFQGMKTFFQAFNVREVINLKA